MTEDNPMSQNEQLLALLKHLADELSDLPEERKARIDADLSKIRSLTSELAQTMPAPQDTEKLLRESEQRFSPINELQDKERELHEAQRLAHIGSWYWNAQTDATTGTDELARIYGFNPEMRRMPDFREQRGWLYPAETWDRLNAAVQSAMQTGIGYELDVEALRNGQPIWVTTHSEVVRDAAGQVIGLRGTVQDITERKQAEQSLRESEERFRNALENTHDSFFILDHDWRIQYVNQRFAGMLGKSVEELTGQVFWNAFPQYLGTPVETNYRKVMQERAPAHFELGGVYSSAWYEVSAFPVQEGISVFATDRTEEHLAQAALQKAHEYATWMARFPEENPNPVVRCSAKGFVLYCNHLAGELAGWKLKTGQMLCDPLRSLVERAMAQAEEVYEELQLADQFYSVSVMPFPTESYANLYGHNITKRKRAEQALRDSEKIYRAIGEAIDYGIWICAPDGRNLYASPSYLNLVGITQQECSDFGWGNTLHPEDTERTIAAWKECVRTGGNWDIEHRFLGKDGQYHPILARGIPVRNEQGEIIYWAGINLDISHMKEVEQSRMADQLQLELQRRLMEQREQERQQIARDLHDGPIQDLSGMLFNIQFAKEALTDLAIQVEFEQIALGLKSTVQNLRGMINEMRPPSLIRFGLSRAIQVYVDEFREKHPEIELRLSLIDEGGCLSEQARLSLYRILQEALANVIKHSNARQIGVVLSCEDHQFRLEVRDDGIGFLRSSNLLDYSALGHFGLVGMQERAEAIGGAFEVETLPGSGTTIRVTVPLNP